MKPGSQWGVAALGHPDGGGNRRRRNEYVGDGKGPKSNTVGSGQNKWQERKVYKSWDRSGGVKAVSQKKKFTYDSGEREK